MNIKQEADSVLRETLRDHEGKLQQHACLSARNRFSLTVGRIPNECEDGRAVIHE